MSATGDAGVDDRGETLIEALAVVAIVGFVAAITFPRMQQGLMVLSQHQAAAVVTARVREARAEALGRDAAVAFVVAADGRSYSVTGRAPAPAATGVTLTATPSRAITFYGDGSSSGGEIRIRAGRRAMTVSVARAGGAVAMTAE